MRGYKVLANLCKETLGARLLVLVKLAKQQVGKHTVLIIVFFQSYPRFCSAKLQTIK